MIYFLLTHKRNHLLPRVGLAGFPAVPILRPKPLVTPKGHVEAAYLVGMQTGV